MTELLIVFILGLIIVTFYSDVPKKHENIASYIMLIVFFWSFTQGENIREVGKLFEIGTLVWTMFIVGLIGMILHQFIKDKYHKYIRNVMGIILLMCLLLAKSKPLSEYYYCNEIELIKSKKA